MNKVGRNKKCPCDSGKKHKKCCLGKTIPTDALKSKDHFQIKGANAEKLIHELATKTFLTDWCFMNPKFPDNKELCDLLVIYDDIAIIWQIKDLKLSKNGFYNSREVKKNLSQLSGARRRLFKLKSPIQLVNSRRTVEQFNPDDIKRVYMISVLVGEGEVVSSFIEEFKEHTTHVFKGDFTKIVLEELDTISDFVEYLEKKEDLLSANNSMILLGGEEELLGCYLLNGKDFSKLKEMNNVLIEEGVWNDIKNRSEFKTKKKADEISYGWDSIINRAHEGSQERYEQVARELSRPNRFERRYLSKAFMDAHIRAHEEKIHDVYRRVIPGNGITYCFLFCDDPEPDTREDRRAHLAAMCFIARGKFPQNTKVIGVATEMKFHPTCAYDYCLLDVPDWSDKQQKEMEKIQKQTQIFVNTKMAYVHEDEYPVSK